MLSRTDTAILLESDDGMFYSVPLVDNGDGIIVPDGDATTGQASSSGAYLALVADNGEVWRWKLKSIQIDGDLVLIHDIFLSPDQSETTETAIDISLAGVWYHVGIEIEDDGEGNPVPSLAAIEADERSSSSSSSSSLSSSSSSSLSSSSSSSLSSSSSQSSSSSSSSHLVGIIVTLRLDHAPDDGFGKFQIRSI